MLAIRIKVKVKPEMRQRFLDAIEVDVRGFEQDEPDSVRFNELQDAADESVYNFYEVYVDEVAVEVHHVATHYAVWRAVADTLNGPTGRIECRSVFPADPNYWLGE